MRQLWRGRLRLLLGLGLLSCWTIVICDRGRGEQAAQPLARLRHGMTPEEVRKLVGPPKRIARQILYHRAREQWLYDPPFPARLQFDCRRGQQPQLLVEK